MTVTVFVTVAVVVLTGHVAGVIVRVNGAGQPVLLLLEVELELVVVVKEEVVVVVVVVEDEGVVVVDDDEVVVVEEDEGVLVVVVFEDEDGVVVVVVAEEESVRPPAVSRLEEAVGENVEDVVGVVEFILEEPQTVVVVVVRMSVV